ncbi:hypothetical protein [Methanobrevibacter sp. UBA212]|uniref:hypothetical protein n=1 Tax=Methanobrevibacter sp. UBA212 TaxID=1915476 RepID=UPI0026006DBF|nr:hypothetical protein [Methanobrevibacter sp. UBA212]
MRRRKDDKRVLRSGNGRQNTSNRKFGRNKSKFVNRPSAPRKQRQRKPKQPRKSSGTLMFIVILALVAFVIGAGIGVSLSFDNDDSSQPHYENVTKEMTENVSANEVTYDKAVDGKDFNENGTSQLDMQYIQSKEK